VTGGHSRPVVCWRRGGSSRVTHQTLHIGQSSSVPQSLLESVEQATASCLGELCQRREVHLLGSCRTPGDTASDFKPTPTCCTECGWQWPHSSTFDTLIGLQVDVVERLFSHNYLISTHALPYLAMPICFIIFNHQTWQMYINITIPFLI